MQWWDDIISWFSSDAGWQVTTAAIIPGVAILVAGFVAALIGRGSTKRIVSLHDRDERAAAVTAMISAARRAANWNSLSAPEQQQADHIALECDVRLRLLPLAGSGLAAEWATHELGELKKQAVSFSFQAAQSLKEFKDRLIEWQAHPARAKKLFKNDLDSWAYEASLNDQDLVAQQKAWEAQQAAEAQAPDAPAPTTAPTVTRPESDRDA
ncbi:hypothetical protein BKA04_000609 [Cryobacterium mesophilum]|uniref:Uncharacterized protein n=1 Tax=Terrimesophilobacter mesophilus TaxID=433647 RepID=A0A4R8V915_9MICO|nr:hypothetical protein [Terrimesophilobacter mesophilus]MBB5632386.1 hypothetical protein [Terrimesophilobacter mesophilus]TFB79223.1 hypothetical protein E3N84_03625 [Terrimesophilobacter mesophilus]